MIGSINRHRLNIVAIAFFWLAVQIILFTIYGVKEVNDSVRYLTYARNIIDDGFYVDRHNVWYIGYVFYLVVCLIGGIGLKGAVLVQVLLGGYAVLCISKLAQDVSKNRLAGYWAALFCIGWIKISTWHFYIMTESLYTSLFCIGCYWIYRIKEIKDFWKLLPLCMMIFFIRPSGITFTLALAALFLWRMYQEHPIVFRRFGLIILSLSAVISYFLLNKMLATFDMISLYLRGELVFAYGTLPVAHRIYDTYLIVPPPLDVHVPYENMAPIHKLAYYVIYNPVHFLKLAVGKAFYYFGNIRPYFSWLHNAVIAIILYPAYYFCWVGFKSNKDVRGIKLFIRTVVISNVLIVILATEDWDGRFLIPILPLIFVFTGIGLSRQAHFFNNFLHLFRRRRG